MVEIHQQQQQQQPEAQRPIPMEENVDVDNPPAAKAKKKTLASFFQDSTQTPTTASSSSTTFDPTVAQCNEAVATELNTYTYMPCVGHEEDPLKWWKCHKINFPSISQKELLAQAVMLY